MLNNLTTSICRFFVLGMDVFCFVLYGVIDLVLPSLSLVPCDYHYFHY